MHLATTSVDIATRAMCSIGSVWNCTAVYVYEPTQGPYFEFNRRHDGRLTHRAVTPARVPDEQRALDNHRRILSLLAEWEQEAVGELFEPDVE